ncbi:MAG: acyl dehydratase [Pseudomonadota bacterium]
MNADVQSDLMDPARACAFQAALGRDKDIGVGSALPPFFHQLYFWSPHAPDTLGRDGHPKVGGGLIPDMGLPRRMWAGGKVQFNAPLHAGVPAQRKSVLESQDTKTGRTGPLGFVTIRHDIWQGDQLRLTEWQDLVYRPDASGDDIKPHPPVARTDATHRQQVSFDSTLLFRYSALTFNGHRIHYDLEYARNIEGYAGLVVHGPLLAQLLMLFAEDIIGPLSSFSFRATAALMQFEPVELCRNGQDMWVQGADGRQFMQAVALSQ